MTVLWLLLGLASGAAFLAVARAQGAAETRTLAVGLVVAAAVYVAFAMVEGGAGWIATEVAGVAAYGGLAWLGVRQSPLWLAAGWGLHTVWDVGLHLAGPGAGIAPTWYAVACVSFDLLVAGYVVARVRPAPPP